MTRKDTILIAVVINAGLLAILFMTAVIYDTDSGNESSQFPAALADNKLSPQQSRNELALSASTGDEVDNVLQYYNSPAPSPSVNQNRAEPGFSIPLQIPDQENENPSGSSNPSGDQFLEVKVKRGDVLEKIAKANRTTVGAIKRANHLENERLTIGQILKIPLKASDSLITTPSMQGEAKLSQEALSPLSSSENEPVYYIVKSGDNPWKIAKQFGVKYDEILRLNHLDEEKARNLKIGDRVRVK